MQAEAQSGQGVRRTALVAALLAAVASAGYHLLLGDLDLNLRDEGYLWYGVLRVLEGEVPLRDFQAYDPGRYYWTAVLAPVFGSGILGVRAAAAVFQALGIWCGLLALRRVVPSAWWLVPATLLFLLWSFPRHKVFEPAITLMAVYAGVRLLERPSVRTYAAAGGLVGLAAVLGRNHGLYLALAFAGLVLVREVRAREPGVARRAAALAGGVVAGYAPVLLMLLFVPGYGSAFLDALLSVADRGTNVPKAYPWPWRAELAGLDAWAIASALARNAAFLLAPLLLPVGLVLALRTRAKDLSRRALVVTASLVGLVYVHHVSVRSDLPHLAQSVHPVLLLALGLPFALGWRPARAALAWTGLLLLTVLVALDGHPELKRWRPGALRHRLVAYDAAGDELRVKAPQAAHMAAVEGLVARHVLAGDELFVVPTFPTFYPLLGKRSPTWWIYFLWPATEEEQAETIRRLDEGGVDWVLVSERAFDDRPEFLFRSTNPLVWRHLEERFAAVPDPQTPRDWLLLRRRP